MVVGTARDVVQQFISGWEQLDKELIVGTVSGHHDLLVWGTDADEVWRSRSDFARSVAEQVIAFGQPRYRWASGDPVEIGGSTTLVVAGTLELDLVVDKDPIHVDMRSTFVLQEEEGTWKIVHAHFSTAESDRVAPY